IKISCGRVGLDHQDLFLILAAAACELARASGYRADASSSQEAKRSPGFFERQRATMRSSAAGTSGLRRDGGSGAAFKIWAQTAPMELPSKGRAPVNIWYRTIPSANWSDRASCGWPWICSGARYAGVPSSRPEPEICEA